MIKPRQQVPVFGRRRHVALVTALAFSLLPMTARRSALLAAWVTAAASLLMPAVVGAQQPASCPPSNVTYWAGGPPLMSGPTNDPLFERQWGMRQIAAPAAWQRGIRGEGVTIAVVDSGVDLNHPDLVPNLVAGHNFVKGEGEHPACPQDDYGHGTHVAGIAAARGGNAIGVTGVAPHAQIMPLRVGAKGFVDLHAVVAAVRYAADAGAHVINMSLGLDSVLHPAIASLQGFDLRKLLGELGEAIDYASARGSLVIAAAGNGLPAAVPAYCIHPAEHPRVICVAASDKRGHPAVYSSLPTKRLMAGAAVRAPGGSGLGSNAALAGHLRHCTSNVEDILSTAWPGGQVICGPAYDLLWGTSTAAPHVAGLAALLAGCGLSPPAIIDTILSTASNNGRWDPVMGYGIVNAEAATRACAPKPALGERPRLRLSVRPRSSHVGRPTRFRFRVTATRENKRQRIRGARIWLGAKRARTDRTGSATITLTLRSPKRYTARACKPGYRCATARVRVLPSRRNRTNERTP